MINDTVWQEIAKRTGVAADKLQEAIASETETAVQLADITIFTDDQLGEYNARVGKESAKTGSKTLVEMQVKELREKNGLEFEGKTIENLMTAFAEKQIKEAKIDPDKKVGELKTSLENLQKQYETDLGLKTNENLLLIDKIEEFKVNGDLAQHLPDGLKGIEQNDFMTLAKGSAKFEYNEDKKLVVKKGGKILKDKMENPISPKDYLTEFALSKKWIDVTGRGGGDDEGGNAGFKTMHDVMKHLDTNKIDPLSPEGGKLIADFTNKQTK